MKGDEHDFVIAVSLGAENMPSFREISLELLNNHPISRTGYSFLTYNSGVKTINTFKQKFSSDSQVKNIIENLPSRVGLSSRLDLALAEAKKLFSNGSGSRPHAKKVVVIYTDQDQTGDTAAATELSKVMEAEGIQIIVVVLDMVNPPPICEVVAPNKESVILIIDEGPKEVVDKIDKVLTEGKFGAVNVVTLKAYDGRHGDILVSAVDAGSRGPGSSPCQGHWTRTVSLST